MYVHLGSENVLQERLLRSATRVGRWFVFKLDALVSVRLNRPELWAPCLEINHARVCTRVRLREMATSAMKSDCRKINTGAMFLPLSPCDFERFRCVSSRRLHNYYFYSRYIIILYFTIAVTLLFCLPRAAWAPTNIIRFVFAGHRSGYVRLGNRNRVRGVVTRRVTAFLRSHDRATVPRWAGSVTTSNGFGSRRSSTKLDLNVNAQRLKKKKLHQNPIQLATVKIPADPSRIELDVCWKPRRRIRPHLYSRIRPHLY